MSSAVAAAVVATPAVEAPFAVEATPHVEIVDFLELPESAYPMPPVETCVCFHYCPQAGSVLPALVTRLPWDRFTVRTDEGAIAAEYELRAITVWNLEGGRPGRLLSASALATHVVSTMPYRVGADPRLNLDKAWEVHGALTQRVVSLCRRSGSRFQFTPTEDFPMWNGAVDSAERTPHLSWWREGNDDVVV